MPAVSDFSAYPADRAGSKSEKSGTPAQFECRLAWTECDSPKSAPGNLDAGRTNKSFKSKFSSGSVTSEPRSPSTASCPDLRRMNQRQEFLTNLRPSPTNPRQVMASGENVHELGYKVASFDRDYSSRSMDFLSCAGFCLCLYTVLNECEQALNLLAPDCSSWGLPCRATSDRSVLNPEGDCSFGFVNRANTMVSRVVCLVLVMLSQNTFYLVEQPFQSLLFSHHRWQWLANRVTWVYEIAFWMQLLGAQCPKRTLMAGNLETITGLNLGRLSKSERERTTTLTTTRKYTDGSGVKRFQGKKKELRASQQYPAGLGQRLHEVYQMQLRLPAQRDLRVRKLPQSGLSEREVFDALPLDDPWLDAGLPTVYAYLYCCGSVRIPNEWSESMEGLYQALTDTAAS